MDKPDTIYVSFIASSRDKAWDLLTDSRTSPDWFFGNRMEVGGKKGGTYRLFRPDGSTDVDGKVLIREPRRRLRVSWVMPDMPVRQADDEVEFLIEDKAEGVIRVAVQEFHGDPVPEKWVAAGREGWSLMLSSLKTLLETGKPLPRVEMKPPD